MPISALPQSTVRLLGSSVIINTPCDVVKELLDNAVDAGASFVEVSISRNHLDTIRVRDDGRGIDVDDFGSLGRRAHTSKLTSFEELGVVARETLGFRGEALAAMNALGSVTVTTRTMNDVVASRLQLKAAVGGFDNRQPVSAPVGTTVQITKLFENMPPRKQYSLKNSVQYIQSTKDLLKGYAFARPDVRLSLKAALNRVAGPRESFASIPAPFMQLNIRCPPYSYDANVTPLKDDVLFANENNIIACFEGICQKTYPQTSIEDPFLIQRPVDHRSDASAVTSDIQAQDSPSSSHLLVTTDQATAHNETSHNGPTTDQDGASYLLPTEPCAQDAKLVTAMRTSRTVNMGRTDSNSTDEEGTVNSLDIQVPLSLMTATPVPAQRADVSSRIPRKCASENIERYLLSRKNDTFQIATDETATKRTQHPFTSTEDISGRFNGRLPVYFLVILSLDPWNITASSGTWHMSGLVNEWARELPPILSPKRLILDQTPKEYKEIARETSRTEPWLMESLSSGVTSPTPDSAQYGLSAGNGVLRTWTPDDFGDTQRDIAPPDRVMSSMEDSRLYLIKRRRSQATHGIARRLSTRRLPLEVIPPQLTVQNASTSLRASLRKVKSLARRARLVEYDVVSGHWGQGIEFKSMEEADKVEQGLQHAVEVWKQTQDQDLDVEYTLCSAAKGKGVCI
ncbi:hypothetical protein MKX07_001847 [Trichoderma sp. CBMAI-0711]|nr:hypothetical protein MKX07_001847 [Trichoderma sp. CBMAI-0711]